LRPFRFLHAADLHLDSPFRGLDALPERVRDTVRESTFASLKRIEEIAVREQVDFAVFSGDIYDVRDRSLKAQLRFREMAGRLAERGIRVFVVHGNHDSLDGYRAALDWPEGVHHFGSDEVGAAPVIDRQGAHLADVYGISFRQAAVRDNLALKFRPSNREVFNVAMLHCNVDGMPGHDNYAPCRKADLIRAGFDYWALGHIHTRAVLHRDPWIVYPGNPQGRSMKETGERGVYVVQVKDRRAEEPVFHPTDSVRWERIRVDIAGLESEQELLDLLRRTIAGARRRADGRHTVVRLVLAGRGRLHGLLLRENRLREWLAVLREEEIAYAGQADADADKPFVWPESLRMETRGDAVDLVELRRQDSFAGDVLRLSDELRRDPERFRQFRLGALEPLMSAPWGRRLLEGLLEDGVDGSAGAGTGEGAEERWLEWLADAGERLVRLLLEGAEELEN